MLKDVEFLLHEQPESGERAPSGDFDNVTVERIYKFNKVYFELIRDSITPGDTGIDNDGYLIDYHFRPSEVYWTLTVKFSQRAPSGLFPAIRINVNTAQHYLDVTPGNLPLWQVNGYFTRWNYNLAARNGVTAVPDWWETVADLSIPPSDAANYRWISEPSQALAGWYILKPKDKPGVSEKLHFDLSVRREQYVRTYEDAVNAIWRQIEVYSQDQMIAEGIKTYGYGNYWLVTPSAAAPEGDLLRLTTMFYHADSWDPDLYGAAGAEAES